MSSAMTSENVPDEIDRDGEYYLRMKTFADALNEAVAEDGTSLRKVAIGAGVSYDMLKKVSSDGNRINYQDGLKVASFFGLSLEDFLGAEEGRLPYKMAHAYSQLSDEQRLRLLGYAEALSEQAEDKTGLVQEG